MRGGITIGDPYIELDLEYEEGEPDCECTQIDVDLMDARDCLLHGPNSDMVHRIQQQEVDDEFAYWRGGRTEGTEDVECPF